VLTSYPNSRDTPSIYQWLRHMANRLLAYNLVLQEALDQVKAEVEERELLGSGATYQRTIP
jgi:hypothetical protein